MRPPRPLTTAALACCCAVLLVLVSGCGAVTRVPGIAAPGTAASSDASPLVRLHAVRTSASPTNHIPAFDAAPLDATRIAQLYATIRALKPFPPGEIYNCPADAGVLYHLIFLRAVGAQVAGLAKPDGCGWAGITESVSGATPHNQIVDWNGFWALFAAACGVPHSALDLSSSSHGPYAPVNVA